MRFQTPNSQPAASTFKVSPARRDTRPNILWRTPSKATSRLLLSSLRLFHQNTLVPCCDPLGSVGTCQDLQCDHIYSRGVQLGPCVIFVMACPFSLKGSQNGCPDSADYLTSVLSETELGRQSLYKFIQELWELYCGTDGAPWSLTSSVSESGTGIRIQGYPRKKIAISHL